MSHRPCHLCPAAREPRPPDTSAPAHQPLLRHLAALPRQRRCSLLRHLATPARRWQYAEATGNEKWKGMSWGMLPSLVSAMCACTWHFFYNSPDLEFLVGGAAQRGTCNGSPLLAAPVYPAWHMHPAGCPPGAAADAPLYTPPRPRAGGDAVVVHGGGQHHLLDSGVPHLRRQQGRGTVAGGSGVAVGAACARRVQQRACDEGGGCGGKWERGVCVGCVWGGGVGDDELS